MQEALLVFAILLGITVPPAWIAARLVRATRTGLGSVILATSFQIVLMATLQHTLPNNDVVLLLSLVGGSVIFSVMLGTTLLKGAAITILELALSVGIVLLIGGSITHGGSAT